MPNPSAETRLNFFRSDLGNSKTLNEKFNKIYTAHPGNWENISQMLTAKKGFSKALVNKLGFTHKVADWTNDNHKLVAAFQKDAGTNSLADIAGKYNRKAFVQLIKKEKAHALGETAKSVAGKLYDDLFHAEPTAMVKRMVSDNKEITGGKVNHRESTLKFLNNLPAGFNIKTTSVNEAFKNKDAFKGIAPENHTAIKAVIKSLQRVAALSPVPETIPVLMKANITSALMISNMPEDQFVKTIAGQLGENGEAIALQVHTHAGDTKIHYETALIHLKEMHEGTGIDMVDNAIGHTSNAAMEALKANNLSWDTLFGDADFCECGECTSVYSAAAYYVELLQYLRNNNLDGKMPSDLKVISNTPLQKLFDRRPDLGCLQLTCKNTNTILPYVDLVNEVMESYIISNPTEPFHTTKPFNVTEDETSGELLSQPQHTNAEAYAILQQKVYPFTLPYHQPIDAARIYLNYLDTSRYEMINTFRSARDTIKVLEPLIGDKNTLPLATNVTALDELYNEYLNRAADAEYLGLTQEEYIILTKEAFVSNEYWNRQTNFQHEPKAYWEKIGVKSVNKYYGYETSPDELHSLDEETKTGLTFVKKQFLKRTGIEYLELVELLKTQSLNPNMPQGQALDIMQKIQLSYRFLQSLVYSSSNPLLKFEFVYGVILRITDPKNIAAIKNKLGIDDPCNEEKPGSAIPQEDLKKWVLNYFEKIGKIIVLDNGTIQKCIDGILTLNNKTVGKIENCIIYYGNELIGTIDKTSGLISLYSKQTVDWTKIIFTKSNGENKTFVKVDNNYYLPVNSVDTCDLDTVRLIHLDGTQLMPDEYNHIHRFIRLWRKLGWSINETDNALVSFRKTNDFEISPQLLHQLVAVKKLNEQTGVELIKLLCLWTNISTVGEKSLYKRLFLTHNLLHVDDVFHDKNGVYLAAPYKKIADHVPVLMAALNLSAEDIEAIKEYKSITDLSLENVSLIYRYRLLSKILGLRVTEFINVLPLFDDPFTNADATLLFLEKWRRMEDAGFNYRQLNYIIAGKDDIDKPLAPAKLKMLQLAKTLYDGINAIEQTHKNLSEAIPPSWTSETEKAAAASELVRSKASLLYDQETVEKIMGILEGTTLYTFSSSKLEKIKDKSKPLLPVPPADHEYLSIDNIAGLNNKVKYNYQKGFIQIKGVLAADEENGYLAAISNAISGTAGVDAVQELTGALNNIKDQQEKIFKESFGKIFDSFKTYFIAPNGGDKNDFPVSQGVDDKNTAPIKRSLFLTIFLPYLRKELIQKLILDTVAAAAGLDRNITDLLINKILTAGNPAVPTYTLLKNVIETLNPNSADLVPSIDGQYTFIVKESITKPLISLDSTIIDFTEQTGTPHEWWSTGQPLVAGNLYKLSQPGEDMAKVYCKTLLLPNIVEPIASLSGWAGYLIPSAGGNYTIIALGIGTMPKLSLNGTPITFIQQTNATDEWWSDEQKLEAGKIYSVALTGIKPESLYWKTATSSITLIPSTCLLPVHAEINTAQAFTQLQKAALLINGFKLSVDEIQYLDDHKADFGDMNLNKIILNQGLPSDLYKNGLSLFFRLESYTRLRNSLSQTKMNILEFFNWVHKPDSSSITLSEKIEALSGWKKERIEKLIAPGHLNISQPGSFYNEINLLKLQKALEVADKIGMGIDLLFAWANPISDFESCRIIAVSIENAIRAKYNQEDWEQVVKPLSDKLRENQKNALIAYLLVDDKVKHWGVTDADGLFEFFLIDVQMDACMETSRIVQAISSVQLFIQRCFLGLEKEHSGIDQKVLDRKRWDWMQRYRVWEANRKVFLYPENWIESNLRDDKSPFFKELESELLQKDINKQNVEDALKAYLYKVDEVANMEVIGLYIEEGKKLHVFSRTRNAPYFFFYRYLDIAAGNWYPWEKMQVDIPSYDVEDADGKVTGNGCYLTPVVWNGRLLIFFPQFMKKTKANESTSNKAIADSVNDSPNNSKPTEYWEIKMAWSEYRNGKWTQKQLSKDAVWDIPPQETATPGASFSSVASAVRDLKDFVAKADEKAEISKQNAQAASITVKKSYDTADTANTAIPIAVALASPTIGVPIAGPIAFGIETGVVEGFVIDFKNKSEDAKRDIDLVKTDTTDTKTATGEALTKATDALTAVEKFKSANATKQLNSKGVISNYEFVPVHDNLLGIKVYYNKEVRGVFEFNGSNLSKIGIQTYPVANIIDVNRFHYNYFLFKSLQISDAANDHLFGGDMTPIYVNRSTNPNTNSNFYHKDAHKLLGIINSQQLEAFFKYPIYDINRNTDKDDVYGGYDNDNDNDDNKITPNIYHELKRPYSIYNWELFFHTPMMLADALSKSQQFEEAMKWYHYVFNPMANGEDDKRFWQFSPFKYTDAKHILDHIFNKLKPNEKDDDINEWRNNPFKPHLVARSRPVAYMKWVVMKYIDNLVAWGDYLFRQDSIESINQATQLYVLAGHILGQRPQMIPKRGKIKPQTYLSLLGKWDAFSNAMVELEMIMPFSNQTTSPIGVANGVVGLANIFGFSSATYFCIPNNPKLMGYWDTVADRLFKIRHCENIEGIFRKLPLFEPPIDPAMLVKAAAQGLSIASVLNDMNTAMPNYRFYYLLQKALELCNELKSMGGAMLSAMEKKDNEAISLIRAKHESSMHNLVMEIKKQQLEEAGKALEGLKQNRKSPEHRMKYYLQLIGEDAGKVPGLDSEFSEIANVIEKPVDESGLKLSKYEKDEMDKASEAHDWQKDSAISEAIASIFHTLPSMTADGKPLGVGGGVAWGFPQLGNAAQAIAKGLQIVSADFSFQSSSAQRKGGFQRVLQDRVMQANAAGYEIKQIDKQILSQQIRIQIANKEITNQQKQIENANEIEEFLKNKYSNEELYSWMKDSLSTLYHQVYSLAFDLAKKAEKTYRFERGLTSSNFINAGYWDAGRNGLLAGENLYVGLKQLEAAYQENRGYDYEITKHISLRQLNPMALLYLKQDGKTEFALPEVLFDMDYPGHYKRRIKSVSISIPCIAGPYTGLNATLRLLENKFRNLSIANNYPEKTDETDDRFNSFIIPINAIAASTGQNDSGMFELNFKDERYLPFEGAGAISKWRLELPSFKQFDYDTISDVIIHVRYTSAEGGERLKASAASSVNTFMHGTAELSKEEGLFALIDLKNDLPDEWYAWKQTSPADNEFSVHASKINEFLPFYARKNTAIRYMNMAVIVETKVANPTLKNGNNGTLTTFRPIDESQTQEIKVLSAEIQDLDSSTGVFIITNPDSNNKILKAWAVVRFNI